MTTTAIPLPRSRRRSPKSSLDPRDRRMIATLLAIITALFILLALVTPAEDDSSNPVPSSYLTGTHGAKAAYTLLSQSGYQIERWHNPLTDLASQSGPSTVLILAEPFPPEADDQRAVREILKRGGRVLATGTYGSLLLPLGRAAGSPLPSLAACNATPEGLSPLTTTNTSTPNSIWITSGLYWKTESPGSDPTTRVDYTCGNRAVVIDYPVPATEDPTSLSARINVPEPDHALNPAHKLTGHAIWWASSTPLENASIERGANLDLLLNSVGPPENHHIYWDESLHSSRASAWDFVHTPIWPLLLSGTVGLILLVVLSFSRRSGPLRALPQPPRTTPLEFLDALGALYRSTGASSTALQIALERFRHQAAQLTGQQKSITTNPAEIAAALTRRFGPAAAGIEQDLTAAEEAAWDETLKPRRALQLIRTLRQHEVALRAASRKTIASQGSER